MAQPGQGDVRRELPRREPGPADSRRDADELLATFRARDLTASPAPASTGAVVFPDELIELQIALHALEHVVDQLRSVPDVEGADVLAEVRETRNAGSCPRCGWVAPVIPAGILSLGLLRWPPLPSVADDPPLSEGGRT